MTRILIVDDDLALVQILRENLEREGFQVNCQFDGVSGLAQARETPPDLLILDWEMPRMGGIDVCRQIRADEKLRDLPILMLTARVDEIDRVLGLELGADDYVPKPVGSRELVARIRAILRRVRPAAVGTTIEFGPFRIDSKSLRVTRDGRTIELSTLEFHLLHFLVSHPSQIFSREQLVESVWGRDAGVSTRTVDVQILRLRQKMGESPSHPTFLKTFRGAGYMFEPGGGKSA
jgi:two-component system, OmpR family, phosphate regulon response regulator PhoB